jgi:hypothetical protein
MVRTSWKSLPGKQTQEGIQIARRDEGRQKVLEKGDPFTHCSQTSR